MFGVKRFHLPYFFQSFALKKSVLSFLLSLLALGLFLGLWFAPHAWAKDDIKNLQTQAQQGQAQAQYQLGMVYLQGKGVEKDESQAFQWLQKAATQEHAKAMFALGELYYYGQGVGANADLAFEWHLKASKKTDPVYLIAPAWNTTITECVPYKMEFDVSGQSNEITQAMWHEYGTVLKEIDKGNVTAQYCLGVMLLNTQGEKETVKQAQARAAIWLKKAALKGYSNAQNDMGAIYRAGWGGIAPQPEKALEWYLQSAQQKNSRGQFGAGMMYLGQFGLKQDISQALHWLALAAEQRHDGAFYQLGKLYEQGIGVEKSTSKALALYEAATEDGVYTPRLLAGVEAAYRAGSIYYHGLGVAPNKEEAIMLFEQAWGMNHRYRLKEAAVYLGIMHITGQGINPDVTTGIGYLQEAVMDKSPSGTCMLKELAKQGLIQPDDLDEEVYQVIAPKANNRQIAANKAAPKELTAQKMYDVLKICPLPKEVPDYLCCF